VKIYLIRDGRLVIAHRQVAPPAVLRGALDALLAGPTSDEQSASLTTAVPAGTTLLDVSLADGLATVDLSRAFGTGGGTLSMQSRLAQIVFTATQFANSTRVLFRMDGVALTTLGGEGLTLTEPQQRMNMAHGITGSVLIDTPAYGATVHSTFTVSGEGDVYEGEFPIEVWSGDRQVVKAEGVRAGAWGTWAPFKVTLTVDAPAGPIRVVAYDAGACGDDPECGPPPVKTVVPLTLAPDGS
jgi:germination protein M